ncbi:uncharacterized protein LOC115234922 isoform X1 [Formica exsecta]|uniref:uncharacterized protein LOC115234922 isoform X1 n=2 Tax=Formica exsecta TaxID=72781 RepID=UPI001143FD83|nr:uncharacterized protein LOC115234922 isoform X1 [Formica exsecta]
MDINKCENERMNNPCNNVPNQLKSDGITSMKMENIQNSPNKADDLQHSYTNCKDENINSPRNSENAFTFLEDIFENSMFKEEKKFLQSANTTEMNVCTQRKKTISISSDYDMFKQELNSTENFNEFEDVKLLHDLNSVIDFEDTKISPDISSLMVINITQETDDSLVSINKDPATDPLLISDCEERNTNATLMDSESKSSIESEKSIFVDNQQISNSNNPFKLKHKLNKKEEHLLEELENIKDWEELPLSLTKKLRALYIKLIHKVPPQHKIELTGSHAPTRPQKKLFGKYGPLRKGLYSPKEDTIIKKNWETFCQLHDWDTNMVKPFFNWRHNGKYYISNLRERQKFVQFLANGLPWRTLYSVYSRFKVLYCKKITYARYTSKEDKKILMYIQNKHLDKRDTKYIELAMLLRRTRRSIFKRYQYLKKIEDDSQIEPLSNIKWTLPLIKKFIKTLLNITLSEDIKELKNAIIPKPVWQKMKEKLNIHENILKTFWQNQLHLQLFSPGPIYLSDIKIKLIEYMYEKGIANTREIIWSNVAQYFDGATAVFLCKVFFYQVQECNMNNMENFADVVEYLYHTKIPEIKEALTEKFLPRIVYKNKKVYLLNEEDSDNAITTDI